MSKKLLSAIIGTALLGLTAHTASATTLESVKAKGFLQCGVNSVFCRLRLPRRQRQLVRF